MNEELQNVFAELKSIIKEPFLVYQNNDVLGIQSSALDVRMFRQASLQLQEANHLKFLCTSNGGDVNVIHEIAHHVRSRTQFLELWITEHIRSAAVLLVFAADQVQFGRRASISPLDPQMFDQNHIHRMSINDLRITQTMLQELCGLEINSTTAVSVVELLAREVSLISFGQLFKGESNIRQTADRLLAPGKSRDQAHQILDRLLYGFYSHEYPIYCQEAQDLGLVCERLEREVDQRISRLMDRLSGCFFQDHGTGQLSTSFLLSSEGLCWTGLLDRESRQPPKLLEFLVGDSNYGV